MSLHEAIVALENYEKNACSYCYVKDDCSTNRNGKCGHLQAIRIGIDSIKYKAAVYNLASAKTKGGKVE